VSYYSINVKNNYILKVRIPALLKAKEKV